MMMVANNDKEILDIDNIIAIIYSIVTDVILRVYCPNDIKNNVRLAWWVTDSGGCVSLQHTSRHGEAHGYSEHGSKTNTPEYQTTYNTLST